MKKVKLILGGRGAECYVHDINEEQKERLINGGVNEDKMTMDLACEILGIDFIEDNDARIYTGAYIDSEDFYIAAYDEDNNLIWESDEDFEFNEELTNDWWDGVEEDGAKLIIEDYIKGTYHEYELELEEDFDPQKLSPVIIEIGETVQIIKNLKYDGKELNEPEWGDYWSKGLYFHIYP